MSLACVNNSNHGDAYTCTCSYFTYSPIIRTLLTASLLFLYHLFFFSTYFFTPVSGELFVFLLSEQLQTSDSENNNVTFEWFHFILSPPPPPPPPPV